MPSDNQQNVLKLDLLRSLYCRGHLETIRRSTACHFNFKQLKFILQTTKAQVLWSFEQSAGQEIRVLGHNKRRADSKSPHRDTKTQQTYTGTQCVTAGCTEIEI
jgi:hypothetical protein